MFPVHVLTTKELTGRVDPDKRTLLDALRRGSCYLSVSLIGPVSGFRFEAFSEGVAEPSGMGESLTRKGKVTLVAQLPSEQPVRIVLLRNGAVVQEQWGRRLEYGPAIPGVYRVEVYAAQRETLAGRLPWILSNPIRVNDPGRPIEVAAMPSCSRGRTLADFEDIERDPLHFDLEGDPVTLSGTGPIEVSSHGAGGTGGSLTLPFAFPSSPARPADHFWSLADRTSKNLEGTHGLSFYVRSDKRLRFQLEIREADPDGLRGEEIFASTFVTTPEWRCVRIRFDQLRPISDGQDGRLDLTKISGMYFVADMTVLKTGTSGSLWLDEVRAYSDLPAEPVGSVDVAVVQIEAVAPALFSANANGRDVAAGLVVLVAADGSQTSISLSRFDPAEGRHVPQPVDVSAGPQDVILSLFGTGISGGGASSSVTATIGGEIADVLFVGPQGEFVGLDQVNLRLPRNLASGSHNIALTVDGKAANIVTVTLQ